MNCYYHPETTIVATCQDCSKGLCKHCSDRYSILICVSCNGDRASKEKSRIFTELAWMIGLPIVATIFMINGPMAQIMKKQPLMPFLFFYGCIGLVAGWNALNKLTARYFLFLPLVGWLFYFVVKLYISGIIGLFIAPFRICKSIMRLRKINQIEGIK